MKHLKKLIPFLGFFFVVGSAYALTTVPLQKNGSLQFLTSPNDSLVVGRNASTTNSRLEVNGTTTATNFVATSTASSTFAGPIVLNGHLTADGLKARTSSGLDFHSNSNAIILNIGAGGGTNATFYGGVNVNGALTGPSATFGSATAGTVTATSTTGTSTFPNASISLLSLNGSLINAFGSTLSLTAGTLDTVLGNDVDLASAEVTGITGVDNGGTGRDSGTMGGLTAAYGSAPNGLFYWDATNGWFANNSALYFDPAIGPGALVMQGVPRITDLSAGSACSVAGGFALGTDSDGDVECVTIPVSGGSGVGTISTSTQEVSGQIPFYTTTNGYPAQLGGSDKLNWDGTSLRVGSSTDSQGQNYLNYNGLYRQNGNAPGLSLTASSTFLFFDGAPGSSITLYANDTGDSSSGSLLLTPGNGVVGVNASNTDRIFTFASSTNASTSFSGGLFALNGLFGGNQYKVGSCDLKADATTGAFYCGTDATGVGGSSTSTFPWYYHTERNLVRLGTTSAQVLIGGTATTSTSALEVQGTSTLSRLLVGGYGTTQQASIVDASAYITGSSSGRGGVIMQNYGTGTAPEYRFAIGDPYSPLEYIAFGLTNSGATSPGTLNGLNKNDIAYILSQQRDLTIGTFAFSGIGGNLYLTASGTASNIPKFKIDGNTGFVGIGYPTSTIGGSLFSVNGNAEVANFTATGTITASQAIFGSSTIGILNATSTTASSTMQGVDLNALRVRSLGAGIMKLNSSGYVGVATAGTDYENPLTFTSPLQRSSNTVFLNTGSITLGALTATNTITANLGIIGSSTIGSLVASSSFASMGTSSLNGVSATYITNSGNSSLNNVTLTGATSTGTFVSLSGTSSVAGFTFSTFATGTQLSVSRALGIGGTTTGVGASFSYLTLNGGNATLGNVTLTGATSSNPLVSLTGTSSLATLTVGFATTTQLSVARAFFQDGLGDCSTSGTSKLLYTLSSGKFSCGTDQTGGGSSRPSTYSYIVDADGLGDFTTIQGALDACGLAGGGSIYLSDHYYYIGGTGLKFKSDDCNVYGVYASTTIEIAGATTAFSTNSAASGYNNTGVHNVVIVGDGTAGSIGIDYSDLRHFKSRGVKMDNLGTGFRLDDKNNATLYSEISDFSLTTIQQFGINASSTNPANNHNFTRGFIGCAVAGCIGANFNNNQTIKLDTVAIEPATNVGTIGVKIDVNGAATNNGTFGLTFINTHIEANRFGLMASSSIGTKSVTGNSFIGGLIVTSAGQNVVDSSNGEAINFFNTTRDDTGPYVTYTTMSTTTFSGGTFYPGLSTCSGTSFLQYDATTGRFSCGTPSSSGGLPGNLTMSSSGNFGVSTDTPMAKLSVVATSSTAMFFHWAFATSTTANPFSWSMNPATTTVQGLINGINYPQNGTSTQRDNTYIGGRVIHTDYVLECQTPANIGANVTADANNVCGGWYFDVDTDAQLVAATEPRTVNGIAYPFVSMQQATPATGDTGAFRGSNYYSATNSPVMSATISMDSATTSGFRTMVGFASTAFGADYGTTFPSNGAYFEASSTANNNWRAVVVANGVAQKFADTGVSTSSLQTSPPQVLRVEVTTSGVIFLINNVIVATHTGTMPSRYMSPIITMATVTAGGSARAIRIHDAYAWLRKVRLTSP